VIPQGTLQLRPDILRFVVPVRLRVPLNIGIDAYRREPELGFHLLHHHLFDKHAGQDEPRPRGSFCSLDALVVRLRVFDLALNYDWFPPVAPDRQAPLPGKFPERAFKCFVAVGLDNYSAAKSEAAIVPE
jgi:hypothetical protein